MDDNVISREEFVGIKTLSKDGASEIYAESNLTSNQLLLWIIQKLHADSPLFGLPTIFTIHQQVEPACFEKAFQTLINSSDALRTVFCEIHGMPQRLVLPEMPYLLEYLDFSIDADPDEALRVWVQTRRERLFDLGACLFDSVLIKLSKEKSAWYLNTHHLIGDGWSIALSFQLLSSLYSDALNGHLAERIALPTFEDYVVYERDFRQSAHHKKK